MAEGPVIPPLAKASSLGSSAPSSRVASGVSSGRSVTPPRPTGAPKDAAKFATSKRGSANIVDQVLNAQVKTAEQRALAAEKQVKVFARILKGLKAGPNLIDDFTEVWLAKKGVHWNEHEGIYGEHVVHWLLMLMPMVTEEQHDLITMLVEQMVDAAPEILACQYNAEPFTGETALHMACANGNPEVVELMLKKREQDPSCMDIDALATGEFFHNLVNIPDCPDYIRADACTPLDVAMTAPADDSVAVRLATLLVQAGASTTCFTDEGEPHGTTLHRLAKMRWRLGSTNGEGKHMTKKRLQAMMNLFVEGKEFPPVSAYEVDKDGNTAAKVAAKVGNEEALTVHLRGMAVIMWEWGRKCEVRVPMKEVDCGSRMHRNTSILEQIILYKHLDILSLGIFVDMINIKWLRFGALVTLIQFLSCASIVLTTTLSCLGERSISLEVQWAARLLALVFSVLALLVGVASFALAFFSCSFFRSLRWLPNNMVLSVFEIGNFSDSVVIILSIICLVLHFVEENVKLSDNMAERIDELTSILMFMGWVNLLRFLGLFETTGTMIAAVPTILRNDLLPWGAVYFIMLIACAGAIRIATVHTTKHGDEVLGSVWNATLTLEEATHGPDVQWRTIVLGQPLVAGAFFLIFLWLVTIALLNILIAMFTDTFERIKDRAFQEFLFQRAVQVVTIEKTLPVWLHRYFDLSLGIRNIHSRPSLSAMKAQHLQKGNRTIKKKMSFEQIGDVEEGEISGPEETDSLIKERWLPITQTLGREEWLQNVKHVVKF